MDKSFKKMDKITNLKNGQKWTMNKIQKGTKLYKMDKNKYLIFEIFNFFHLLCLFSVNKTIFDGFEAL